MATSTLEPSTQSDRNPAAKQKLVEKTTPSKTRSEYRPDIDGIRGAAAIMVMGFHAKVPGFEGAYIGLDLFFVVSGYVITGLLMYEFQKTGGIRWGAFYARRARRLIPAKATMLIGVLILSYFIATPTGSQQETARSAGAAAGFFSNFFFWQSDNVDYFGHQPGTGVLLHTWSLSVEEQFYLGLPIAILLAWGLSKALRVPVVRTLLFTTVALAIASCWLAITWADLHPKAAYYMPITRAFEFLMGVALALVVRRLRLAYDLREVMGLAGIAICAFVIWKPMPVDGYPSYWALLPCTAAVLMTWAGVGGPTLATRFLSIKFLVGLGLISYGWYLWHWPFLVLGESINLAPPPLYARVLLIFAALGVAYLSYRFIEGLFYKRSGAKTTGPTWGSKKVIISGVVAMSSVAGLSTAAVALADDQAHTPRWEKVITQLTDYAEMPSECLGETFIPDKPQKCMLVPFERDRPTVVLWGDSHAWMYIPAIEAAARKRDVNLVAFVMGACPPFEAPEDDNIGCARNNRMALDFVSRLSERKQPLRVITSASWETYRGATRLELAQEGAVGQAQNDYVERISELFSAGAVDLFEELGALGVQTDIVGPTPTIPRNAPLCAARPRPYSCDVARSDAILDEDDNTAWLLERMAALPKGSKYIDATPTLCDDNTCFAESEGVVNYFDDNHLSAKLSRRLKKYFAPSIRSVVG
ncbi:MAG: acyltransferase family protein [Nocardioides sp.]